MLLEARDLTAGYAGLPIVNGVSFMIEDGEAVALLGRNGMGKTTLLRAVFGLADRYGGQVLVDGEPIPPGRGEALARRGITFVPDDRGVFPRLSVAENLALAALLGRRRPQRVADPLEIFPELADRREMLAGHLSGGLQQQLAIARALAGQPRLILIDELSQGIQPSVVDELAGQLADLSGSLGMALLVVDQVLDVVARICTRALIMQKGAITADVPIATVLAEGAGYRDLLVI
jgi:ABC-type branched-subunit amino acid transport system ATPase component